MCLEVVVVVTTYWKLHPFQGGLTTWVPVINAGMLSYYWRSPFGICRVETSSVTACLTPACRGTFRVPCTLYVRLCAHCVACCRLCVIFCLALLDVSPVFVSCGSLCICCQQRCTIRHVLCCSWHISFFNVLPIDRQLCLLWFTVVKILPEVFLFHCLNREFHVDSLECSGPITQG